MNEPTDGNEARKAVADAKASLKRAKDRQGAVSSIVGRLNRHLEDDHFADRLAVAFGQDGGKD